MSGGATPIDLHRLTARRLRIARRLRDADHLADRILALEEPPRQSLVDNRHTRRRFRLLLRPCELAAADQAQAQRGKVIGADDPIRARPGRLLARYADALHRGGLLCVAKRQR